MRRVKIRVPHAEGAAKLLRLGWQIVTEECDATGIVLEKLYSFELVGMRLQTWPRAADLRVPVTFVKASAGPR
jgi:hypothetical protein